MHAFGLARRTVAFGLAALVALGMSGACAPGAGRGAAPGGAAPAPASAAPGPAPPALQPVTMAYVNALDNAPLFVGIDRGYWQEQGIVLSTEPVQSSADAIAFLANGQLD